MIVHECPSCHTRTLTCHRCEERRLMGTMTTCPRPNCGAVMMCAGCGLYVDLAGRGMERADGEILPWPDDDQRS